MKRKARSVSWSVKILLACFLAIVFAGSQAGAAARPRYVFFFIGDGMSAAQVTAAEIYLSSVDEPVPPGIPGREKLAMSKFPVQGLSTTFGNNSYIPGSADAGTALACGMKTNSGVIAMDPAKTVRYTSIAKLAKKKGMKVGIVSSVSIDHATPAVFYANNESRNNYYDIAMQMAKSNFDYFGGGGIKNPTGDGTQPSVIVEAEKNGFIIADTAAEFLALNPGRKAIAYSAVLDKEKALYYELDRKQQPNSADHISLAEFTRKGIELLDNPKGFFMMVEGGKIDWACHANDARASIDDVIALSDAVKEAVEFYKKRPGQTLIVVTGDHETGGMSIGFAGTKYATMFERLKDQKLSYVEFDKILDAYKSGQPAGDIDNTLKGHILDAYGLDFDKLNGDEKELLEEAYDRFITRARKHSNDKDYLLYGGYNAFSVTLTRILNQRAGIGWTTYSHTGLPVPVYAMGAGSLLFGGIYDNTDVAKKIAEILKVKLEN